MSLRTWLAKNSKKRMDTEAIHSNNFKKNIEIEGVEELMSKGNIKEAAVVFSQEGMKAFAHMFGNSIDSAVTRVLNDRLQEITEGMAERIESVVDKKMVELLEGLTEGMKSMQEQVSVPTISDEDIREMLDKAFTVEPMKAVMPDAVKEVLDKGVGIKSPIVTIPDHKWVNQGGGINMNNTDIVSGTPDLFDEPTSEGLTFEQAELEATSDGISKVEEPEEEIVLDELPPEPTEDLPRMEHDDPDFRYGSSTNHIEIIAPYVLKMLKDNAGVEMQSAHITSTLREVYNIRMTNPTLVYRRLMKDDPNIENTGFGTYKYEEKNFNSTL